jgi:hypothetical protein
MGREKLLTARQLNTSAWSVTAGARFGSVTLMVRSAKRVSNHEARPSSFETRLAPLLRMRV